MSRAETRTPERLEAYAQEVQRRANERLAALGFHPLGARAPEVAAIIGETVPETWEWVDASTMGGAIRIEITRYDRP